MLMQAPTAAAARAIRVPGAVRRLYSPSSSASTPTQRVWQLGPRRRRDVLRCPGRARGWRQLTPSTPAVAAWVRGLDDEQHYAFRPSAPMCFTSTWRFARRGDGHQQVQLGNEDEATSVKAAGSTAVLRCCAAEVLFQSGHSDRLISTSKSRRGNTDSDVPPGRACRPAPVCAGRRSAADGLAGCFFAGETRTDDS